MISQLLLISAAVSTFFLCIVLAVSAETTDDNSGNCCQRKTWAVYMGFAAEAIGKARNSSVTCNNTAATCGQKDALQCYLEVADDMINKARKNLPTCYNCNISQPYILDCSDLLRLGNMRSGVYTISPTKRLSQQKVFDVYCDMETDGGGWTVIQRRGDFQNPVDYFFKDWRSYKEGFGNLEKEFWLGNDNIFALTNQEVYTARFDLMDFENNRRYAYYDEFWINGENSKYTLHVSKYSGDAGDSMKFSNHQKFSTYDEDNDTDYSRHCAQLYKGGWWFKHCYQAHLNGQRGEPKGVIWIRWKGHIESLAWTEIKIRPKYLGF